MEPYQIILLILLISLLLYSAVAVYIISNARDFRIRLRRREKALMMLLSEKADILEQVVDRYETSKVSLSEEDRAAIASLKALTFDKIGQERVAHAAAIINEAHTRLNYHRQSNKWIQGDLALAKATETYAELDGNYRQSVAIYNADVAGYNYWLAIPMYGFLVMLFGFRKRKGLN
ncbi:MAG: hypothetical protein IJU64_00215 [Bacilli bacterium]|nr:hypothetical protein [Bacilli bacterium]